jgi:MoaA/NifB/PqqE/SkfB family radical SAM enzyme
LPRQPGRAALAAAIRHPLVRDDVYQLVDHAHRRGLKPAVTLSPTANATTDAIARLRRNGLSRIIVSLEGASADSHDESCGMAGSYRRTLHIIGTALLSGIDVEVNTLVTRDNIDVLDALYERIERLGVVAWNVYVPVLQPGVEPLSAPEVSQVQKLAERLRLDGLMEVRLVDPGLSTVFITSEGYVRGGEFVSATSGDLRRNSLTQICRSH